MAFVLLYLVAANGWGTDWPQYRGINHDGTSPDPVRTNWAVLPPRVLWRTPLLGWGNFCVSGGRVYVLTGRTVNGRQQEGCLALDAETGSELWFTPVSTNTLGKMGNSTPATDGLRVFVLSHDLQVAALESDGGKVIWQRDLIAQDQGQLLDKVRIEGNAASPLLEGDLVYVNCSAKNGFGLLAVRKTDGQLAWKTKAGSSGFASPIAATILGTRQVLFFTKTNLVSVVPETGSVLWSLSDFNEPYITPVVVDDVVIYASYLDAAKGVQITRSGDQFKAQQIWSTDLGVAQYASPVGYQGVVYWATRNGLACLHPQTGKTLWKTNHYSGFYGTVSLAGNLLVEMRDSGSFCLVDASPSRYVPQTDYCTNSLVKSGCYNHPVISNGRIYIRGGSEGICVDVGEQPSPQWQVLTPSGINKGTCEVTVSAVDSTSLNSNPMIHIDLLATTNLGLPRDQWIVLTNFISQTNGALRFSDPEAAAVPQRFYLGRRRP